MDKRRRFLVNSLCLAIVLGVVGSGAAYWIYRTTGVDYQLQRGAQALEQGDWDEVERLALRLEGSGHHDQAHLLRGKILFCQAKPSIEASRPARVAPLLEKALKEFNQISDQGDIRLEADSLSGQCLLHLQQRFAAGRLLRKVVRQKPDDIDVHRGLAALYFDQGALKQAASHCEEWARLDPRDGRPSRWMGHIYKDLDYNREAIASFQEALRRELGDQFREDVKENLAELLVKQSEYEQALSILESCDQEQAGNPKLLALRGQCLWGLQRTAEARALLDRAIKDHGGSADLMRVRAEVHLQEKEPQPAALLLERVLATDRHDQASRHLLIQAYESLGRRALAAEQRRLFEQTQDLLHELTKLNGEAMLKAWDAALRQRLAEICDKLDKPELAAMWRRAAAAVPAPKKEAPTESQTSK